MVKTASFVACAEADLLQHTKRRLEEQARLKNSLCCSPQFRRQPWRGTAPGLSLLAASQFNGVQDLLGKETQRNSSTLQEFSEAARERSGVGGARIRASLGHANTQLVYLFALGLSLWGRRLTTRQSRADCRTCPPC